MPTTNRITRAMKKTSKLGQSHGKYLTDYSEKEKPWDIHRAEAVHVANAYEQASLKRHSERINKCSRALFYNQQVDEDGVIRFKLKHASFCRVRFCPICQWRKSKMWVARFLKAFPRIAEDYPKARFIFLTLTVRNCEVSELRETLKWMNKSWQKLTQRKVFPAIGFVRSTEVTRRPNNMAHPHFHCVLMVKPRYFKHGYLSQAKWTELWKSCLKVDYTPVINVKVVRPKKRESEVLESKLELGGGFSAAVVETLKYSVKPQDMLGKTGKSRDGMSEEDLKWFVELNRQLHKTRAVVLGGVFRQYLSEKEPEDLVGRDEKDDEEFVMDTLVFEFLVEAMRYLKIDS